MTLEAEELVGTYAIGGQVYKSGKSDETSASYTARFRCARAAI